MSKYKLIASDLDGTLLGDDARISAENLSAVDELIKKGVLFVPCSGRTMSEIPGEIKNNPGIRYMIYSNGAAVIDRAAGKRIMNGITRENLPSVLDIIYSYDCHRSTRSGGEFIVEKGYQTEEDYVRYNLIEGHVGVIRDFAIVEEDFRGRLEGASDVEVFSVFFKNHADKDDCRRRLEALGTIHTAEVCEYNLEIMSKTSGKGNALKILAEMLGIDMSEIITVGDSGNDRSMTLVSGLGLATANACDDLKSVADKVICSNGEHIARYLLEQYFSD